MREDHGLLGILRTGAQVGRAYAPDDPTEFPWTTGVCMLLIASRSRPRRGLRTGGHGGGGRSPT
ncbi:MAG: hypothetical protein M3N18_12730, partial [Actinomycetota bacterium]|nr:hypothetical protein [Actinomycetota bacterium]